MRRTMARMWIGARRAWGSRHGEPWAGRGTRDRHDRPLSGPAGLLVVPTVSIDLVALLGINQ